MFELSGLASFGLLSLGLALTPGPNMLYLISRSICSGRKAGMISLCGIAVGYVIYLLLSALGITALILLVPFAFDTLRFCGAIYLLFLAWQIVRPGGSSPFEVRELSQESDKKFFMMGFLTNLLNPKVAMIYVSLLPQFIDVSQGRILVQTLLLGLTQIFICLFMNAVVIITASSLSTFFNKRALWLKCQRWLMGTILAGLSVHMLISS